MLLRAKASARIDAPAERVFAIVTDTGTMPRVFRGFGVVPAIEHSEVLGEGTVRVGAIRRVVTASGWVIDEHIAAHQPPHLHAYGHVNLQHGPVSWMVRWFRGEWRLRERGGRTVVVWTYRLRMTSPLLIPLGLIASRVFLAGAMRRALALVKAHAEQGRERAPAA